MRPFILPYSPKCLVLVFGAKCRSRLDLRGGGTKKAPKHYQNPSIKLRSRPKSAFLRSCTGKPRSFAPQTSTRYSAVCAAHPQGERTSENAPSRHFGE